MNKVLRATHYVLGVIFAMGILLPPYGVSNVAFGILACINLYIASNTDR